MKILYCTDYRSKSEDTFPTFVKFSIIQILDLQLHVCTILILFKYEKEGPLSVCKLSLLVLHTFYLGIIARIWIGMSFVCLIGNRTPTLLSYFRYESHCSVLALNCRQQTRQRWENQNLHKLSTLNVVYEIKCFCTIKRLHLAMIDKFNNLEL